MTNEYKKIGFTYHAQESPYPYGLKVDRVSIQTFNIFLPVGSMQKNENIILVPYPM